MHTCSTGPERAGDWGQSQARLTATVRRTDGRAQPWLGWATHSHSQIGGVAGKEGMRIFIHCQGNSGGNKTATGDDGCVVIEEFQIFLGLGKWKFHIRTFVQLYRLVIILSLSHTIQQDLQILIHKFDVWLTVHRSSVWNKKPTTRHLVLYLFLVISCSTCFGPPCAHLQELTT